MRGLFSHHETKFCIDNLFSHFPDIRKTKIIENRTHSWILMLSVANVGIMWVKLRKGIWWRAASLMGTTDRQAGGSSLSPSLGSGWSLWNPSQWISETDRDVHTCYCHHPLSCWWLWPSHFCLLNILFIMGRTRPWLFPTLRWADTGHTLLGPVTQLWSY